MNEKILLYLLFAAFIHTAQCQFSYIYGGAFKFVTGISMPVDVNIHGGSLSWFTNLQIIYDIPKNITFFEPYKIMQKRSVKNTFNRLAVYQALTKYFTSLGMSGSDCICKIVCTMAKRKNTYESNNNLVEDFVEILFSPRDDWQSGLELYKKAHWQGMRNISDCSVMYPQCNILEPFFI